jgi:hypothetical protein
MIGWAQGLFVQVRIERVLFGGGFSADDAVKAFSGDALGVGEQDCQLLSLMLADIHEEIRPALVREGQEGAQDQLAARPDLHLIPLPAGDDGDVQIIVFA